AKAISVLMRNKPSPLLQGESFHKFLKERNGSFDVEVFPDSTCYLLTCPTQYVPQFLPILGKQFANFFLDIKMGLPEIEILKNCPYSVGEEFAEWLADSDIYRNQKALLQLLREDHPLQFITNGAIQSQECLSIRNWMRWQYAPQDATLILFSPQKLDKLVDLVADSFSYLPVASNFSRKETVPVSIEESKAFFFISNEETKSLSLVWEFPINI
ncbi:hypothetical protein, partial [Candidatus Similichlamydia epinepheli]|uniref:hypothetical protein n=1 Tax=Candidatus Similichlamydia epinepheli TaxID=1903953 RepID=UPI00195B7D88